MQLANKSQAKIQGFLAIMMIGIMMIIVMMLITVISMMMITIMMMSMMMLIMMIINDDDQDQHHHDDANRRDPFSTSWLCGQLHRLAERVFPNSASARVPTFNVVG